MRKIPTLFVRDEPDRRYVIDVVSPGCEWVPAGEGVATQKTDGTCMRFDGQEWWARREVKAGKQAPAGYVPVETDPATGKTVGWEPVGQSAYAKYHAEALANGGDFTPGTYELCGPKVNGNPEQYDGHVLIGHGWAVLSVREDVATAPRDFAGLCGWLWVRPYEGIVWHHPDGRMAKLKRRDFPGGWAGRTPPEINSGEDLGAHA